MATITTLTDVEQWLRTKPAEEIVCWDVFEPRHSLMVRYYTEQGHKHVRSEWDRAVEDPRQPGEPIKTIATYDADLSHFKYALLYTPLRFEPQTGALLDYLVSGAWRTRTIAELSTLQTYPFTNEQYNAHYERVDRPADLPWQHREHVSYKEAECSVVSMVYPASFPSSLRDERMRSIALILTVEHGHLEYLRYTLAPAEYHQTLDAECQERREQQFSADANLLDQDTITIQQFHSPILGTWQRQGEILVKIA